MDDRLLVGLRCHDGVDLWDLARRCGWDERRCNRDLPALEARWQPFVEIGLMQRLGESPTELELEQMMAEVDADGSGSLDFEEFIGLMRNVVAHAPTTRDLKEAFHLFDKDGNGTISLDELKEAAKEFSMTESDMEEVLKEVDTNGDGSIDYEEFLHMMTQLNERAGVPTPRRKIEAVF